LNKSLEELSSGLRINRAADDAAGLAIAERFRSQVPESEIAQRDVQDGGRRVQTAEGALTRTMGILQHIRERAVQAANGTQRVSNRIVYEQRSFAASPSNRQYCARHGVQRGPALDHHPDGGA